MQLFSCQLFNMVVLFKILASRWWQASKGRAILYFATTPSPSSPEEGSFESLPKDGSSKMSFSLVFRSVCTTLGFARKYSRSEMLKEKGLFLLHFAHLFVPLS